MRQTTTRRALGVVAVAAFGLLAGAAPALAAEAGTAYSKAELIKGSVLGQGIINPIVQEFPPGGKIAQPSLNIANVVTLDLDGLGAEASGDKKAGTSYAAIKGANLALGVGLPGLAQLKFTEAGLMSECWAKGGELGGQMTLVAAKLEVLGPLGISLGKVDIPVNAPPNTGIQVPGGLAEVLINKQVRKDGVITVTQISVNVLGQSGVSVEFGKVTCGPNIPEPPVPAMSPSVLAAGVLVTAGVGGGFALRRRRATAGAAS